MTNTTKNIHRPTGSRHPAYLASCAVLAGALAAIFWFHIYESADFQTTLWTGRDHVRAVNLFTCFEYCGAEMSSGNGMRLPGPLLYLLWKLPLLIYNLPVAPHVLSIIMNIAAALVLTAVGRRYLGLAAGLTAGLFYMASPVTNDTVLTLWNPAFMPLFIILAYRFALEAIIEDRTQSIKWFFFCTALAIQLHMSAIILVPAFLIFLPDVLWRGSRAGHGHWTRPLIASLGLVMAAMAPYFIGDMFNGFENTRLLYTQDIDKRPPTTMISNITLTVQVIFDLLSCSDGKLFCDPGTAVSARLTNALGNIFVWTGIAGTIWYSLHFFVVSKDKEKQRLKGLLFLIACLISTIAVYHLFSPEKELRISIRYILIVVPALALLAGAAVEDIGRMLRVRGLTYVYAVFYPAFAAAALFSIFTFTHFRNPSEFYRKSREIISFLKHKVGWSLEEISGRTVSLISPDGGKTWCQNYDLLNITDFETDGYFPGSLPCPGALILWESRITRDPDLLDNFDSKFLRNTIPDLQIIKRYALGNSLIVIYSIPGGRAFTSMSNRYILSPEEKISRQLSETLTKGTACRIEDDAQPDRARFGVNLDGTIQIFFDLHLSPGRANVTMHSNQLRGTLCNRGFFDDGAISAPRLIFEKDGQRTVFVISCQSVGFDGVYTPISASAQLEPGTYQASFCANVIPLSFPATKRPMTEHLAQGQETSVVLGTVTVPGK